MSPLGPGPVSQRRTLGRSSVTVSRIGFGSAPIAGLYTSLGEADARRAMEAAWDAGIRYYDTAPHYGAGLAERRLGAFLGGRPRSDFTVSTKVGRLLRPGPAARDDHQFHGSPGLVRVRDYTERGVYRSLAESLERSGLGGLGPGDGDREEPDDHWAAAVGEAFPALARLRAEGAVGAVGVGMNQTALLARFVRETDLDCVLVAGRYTLLDRGAAEELLPLCASREVGVLVGGVFNSGVLADPDGHAYYDYAPAAPDVLARARALAGTCAEFGVPLPAAAVQFPLRHPAVTGVVLGLRSVSEVRASAAYAAMDVPDELWTAVHALAPR